MMMKPRVLEVRTNILKQNDQLARQMRDDFARQGVLVCNLVSSPGSGKTELLTKTLADLHARYRVAAIVGDLATDCDAKRLATSGAPTRQIQTDGLCHLEADMVARVLSDWQLGPLDFLFIENVGNLVCPTSWDLGEDLRVLLTSVTEGEDKPLKYPTLINTADLVLVSKVDLAEAVGFDRSTLLANIQAVRPGVAVHEVSARSNVGFAAWIEYLEEQLRAKRSAASV
jgi:hydrogenase nickel incorporation protein HypB